ncbi:MAG: hypothetical protein AB7I48_06725 [Planctomycetaceae bacterium]
MAELREKRARLLRETAEVEVELARWEGPFGGGGGPHDSVIELRGHEFGQQLARSFQQRQRGEVVAAAAVRQRCPECGELCAAAAQPRQITAWDGPLELLDVKSHCPRCRRDFFPSAGSVGV